VSQYLYLVASPRLQLLNKITADEARTGGYNIEPSYWLHLQVRLRSEEDVREGRLTPKLEEAEFQKVFDEIDCGKKPCAPDDRSWFEKCLGTDNVCSCLEAIQKAEVKKALSNSKLMEKVLSHQRRPFPVIYAVQPHI